MRGLDVYSTSDLVGIDWLNFGGSALKAAGGAFGGGGSGGQGGAPAASAADLQRARDQAAAAQQSASNWKMIGVAGVAVIIIGAVMMRKKK